MTDRDGDFKRDRELWELLGAAGDVEPATDFVARTVARARAVRTRPLRRGWWWIGAATAAAILMAVAWRLRSDAPAAPKRDTDDLAGVLEARTVPADDDDDLILEIEELETVNDAWFGS